MSEAVRIRAIAAGGDGVGTLADGRAVFVPRTAPGDLAELCDVRLARRFARARLARLLEASAVRVTPACPHYEADDCGSCQLQHLDVAAQRSARRQLVGDALRRIGKLASEEPELEPSDAEWNYRAKLTLSARGARIGYRRLGQPDQVFELERCPIARSELNGLWTVLRSFRSLLPRNLDRLVLRVDRNGGRHLMVSSKTAEVWNRGKELGALLARAGAPAVLWWQPPEGAARAVAGARDAYPVTVFEQVHPVMGDRARAYAIGLLGEGIATGPSGPRAGALAGMHVWDLYAGIGETTRALRTAGASVESIELNPRAVRLAEALGPPDGVTRYQGRVEDKLSRLKPADGAIVNPPRTGLGDEVTEGLRARGPEGLVYVSCDPATLARDVNRLAAGYQVAQVRAFDFFPQTAHVETVVLLTRS